MTPMPHEVRFILPFHMVYDQLTPTTAVDPLDPLALRCIVRYWLSHPMCRVLDPDPVDAWVPQYRTQIADDSAYGLFEAILEGPLHPAMSPLFHLPITQVSVSPRTLQLRWVISP